MGLFARAVETYDTFSSLAGVYREGQEVLAPIAHAIATAKIEITIDANGSFISANAVDEKEEKIVIPVTEASRGRTSTKIAPHLLCEQVGYLIPANKDKRKAYLSQLAAWRDSDYTHPFLKSVYVYISSGTIVNDLSKAGLIEYKDGSISNESDIVRWRIVGLSEQDSDACWKNHSLMNAHIAYQKQLKEKSKSVFCFITGDETLPAIQHPKKIVPLYANAKLISSNDTSGFTYHGRFENDMEAVTVGYETSQKAHAAIGWLISNQGIFCGEKKPRIFLCWNPHGKPLNKATVTDPLLNFRKVKSKIIPTDYKDELWRIVNGLKTDLPDDNTVVIASFDATTKNSGRLSVTYYDELSAMNFWNHLLVWDEWCSWAYNANEVFTPSLFNIVECAFGDEREVKSHNKQKEAEYQLYVDEKLFSQQIQRIIIARLNGGTIPFDFVQSITNRAAAPQSYKEHKNWNNVLVTACAIIRKYRHDMKGEVWNMALEPDKQNRSYQYGRLLAVMEKAEQDTYEKDKKRETNAERMMMMFRQRPQYTTVKVIEQLRSAYWKQLELYQRVAYDKLMREIFENLSAYSDAEQNKPLDDTYLMGYYLQRNEFFKSRKNNESDEEEE